MKTVLMKMTELCLKNLRMTELKLINWIVLKVTEVHWDLNNNNNRDFIFSVIGNTKLQDIVHWYKNSINKKTSQKA